MLLALLVLAGCGEKDEPMVTGVDGTSGAEGPAAVPGGADPADVRIIDGWVTALARGDVEAAARYFAIPSIAENGPVLVRIDSHSDARLFNRSLPCGAKLIRAVTEAGRTTATFRLTERPGPGVCGAGTGETAATRFEIEHGRIVEWRRVGLGGGERPPATGEPV
jgi:limonene-1,2-epoxide hydrolase